MTQGYTCIFNSFGKINLYMKLKHNIMKKNMHKIGNTSQNA